MTKQQLISIARKEVKQYQTDHSLNNGHQLNYFPVEEVEQVYQDAFVEGVRAVIQQLAGSPSGIEMRELFQGILPSYHTPSLYSPGK